MTSKATTIAGLVIGIIAAAVGVLLIEFSLGNGLKFASCDMLFALRPVMRPAEALVIYMDEESHAALNQSLTEPWDRNLHAKLLERISAAKAVVFDVHFSGEGRDPDATANLARAIKNHGRVVLGADAVRSGTGLAGIGMKSILPPFEPLGDAAAEIGSVELDASHDVVVRKHLQQHPDDLVPPLSWASAKVAGDSISEFGDRSLERWINYYGPPGTIPHVGYERALTAPPSVFSNKVVFVGAKLMTKLAGERKDEFRSPYVLWMKENLFIPGVEIQATKYLNLARQDWLKRSRPATEKSIVILIGLLAGMGLIQIRPWFAAALTLAVAILIMAVAYFLFWNWNLWFPWLILVVVQLPVALASTVLYQSFRLYLENKLLEQSLARHLSPVRAKQLLRHRELLKPGAEKQLLSIMFTDIADFTKISEGMDSAKLARLMNNYFEEAISCVYASDGCLVKLIGDALFAIWNAPMEQPDHIERVFRAALLLQERVSGFPGPNGIVLRTRIGIHSGVADVGNFGSAKRFDYTAIGENINLASRLEGLNKFLGTTVLASRDAQAPVAGKFHFCCVGRFRLKGFAKAVEVYELLPGPADWQPIFAEALQHFRAGRFDQAEAAFCRVAKLRGEDGPSRFYLSQLQRIRAHTPSTDWTGEIELLEK